MVVVAVNGGAMLTVFGATFSLAPNGTIACSVGSWRAVVFPWLKKAGNMFVIIALGYCIWAPLFLVCGVWPLSSVLRHCLVACLLSVVPLDHTVRLLISEWSG